MKLSIIIPAYNEEERLPPTLDAYGPYFVERYGDDVEFVLVVNGSTDRTEELVRAYAKRIAQIKLVVEPEAIGKGGAIMLGLRHAAGELLGFTDGDGATPPAAFNDLVENIGDAGVIIGSRWKKESVIGKKQPLSRRIASRIFNRLVNLLFSLNVTDTQCGAKVMRRKALEDIIDDIGVTRWAFDVDLLFKMRRAGYKIVERPTTWNDKAGSKINVPKASVEMFTAIMQLRLRYSPLHWFVVFFNKTIGRFIDLDKLQK